jgi:hypothetical protein
MQFSSHQELTTMDQPGQTRQLPSEQELQPNRILLITIHNPLYPITVDVLHQVFPLMALSRRSSPSRTQLVSFPFVSVLLCVSLSLCCLLDLFGIS